MTFALNRVMEVVNTLADIIFANPQFEGVPYETPQSAPEFEYAKA